MRKFLEISACSTSRLFGKVGLSRRKRARCGLWWCNTQCNPIRLLKFETASQSKTFYGGGSSKSSAQQFSSEILSRHIPELPALGITHYRPSKQTALPSSPSLPNYSPGKMPKKLARILAPLFCLIPWNLHDRTFFTRNYRHLDPCD